MMASAHDVADVLSVSSGHPVRESFNRKRRGQYQDAIEQIKKKFNEHVLQEERSRKPILTKFENGIIEAYVPIHMIKPNEEMSLFRLSNIPLVFKNEVFIEIRESSTFLAVQKIEETERFYILKKDELSRCSEPKSWYERQSYFCRERYESLDATQKVFGAFKSCRS